MSFRIKQATANVKAKEGLTWKRRSDTRTRGTSRPGKPARDPKAPRSK